MRQAEARVIHTPRRKCNRKDTIQCSLTTPVFTANIISGHFSSHFLRFCHANCAIINLTVLFARSVGFSCGVGRGKLLSDTHLSQKTFEDAARKLHSAVCYDHLRGAILCDYALPNFLK